MTTSTNPYREIYQARGWAFARYWVSYGAANRSDLAALNQESPNLIVTLAWLTDQPDNRAAHLLLEFIDRLTPYLQQREQAQMLVNFCDAGLLAAGRCDVNPGWLYLLRHEGQMALGVWNLVLADLQTAACWRWKPSLRSAPGQF
jgi:hypothetical protein